jgi:hypothetical protein
MQGFSFADILKGKKVPMAASSKDVFTNIIGKLLFPKRQQHLLSVPTSTSISIITVPGILMSYMTCRPILMK